jgi:threonylcarbamoyladenosine tRNA methylthiotransferase MtaB
LGNKRHDHRFIDLLLALDEVDGLDRIRISSIEPNLLNQEVIDFVSGSQRFVPHFHIPLQSGNNEILGLMKRRYQRELYQERVEAILARHPDACIGVDVIVGFPGETEDHFLDTYQFLQNLPIGYLHVFTYSERPGTEAIDLPGVVPPVERKARNHRLRLLSAQKQKAFALAHEGSVRRVLWEDADRQGYMQGYTENYIRVSAPFDTQRAGTVEHIVLGPWNAQDTMSVQSIVQPSVAS